MKQHLYLIFIFLTFLGYSQENNEIAIKETDSKNEISKANDSLQESFAVDIVNYLKAFNEKDWDGVIEKIYPKLFDLLTKEQMIETFKSLETMGMDMTVEFNKIENITSIVTYENSRYCRVYYNGIVKIKVSGNMLENKEQFNEGLQMAYGINNVKFYEENNTFIVNANKSMVAISEKGTNSWKYIEYNEQGKKVLFELIPTEVLRQIEN